MLRAVMFAVLPVAVLVFIYVLLDPFKVLRWHDEPFADHLGLNKGSLSVNSFEQFNPETTSTRSSSGLPFRVTIVRTSGDNIFPTAHA